MSRVVHTPGLDRTLQRLADEFGMVEIDHEGTVQMRRSGERSMRLATCFYSALPGTEFRYWVIDEYGEIMIEAGAKAEA